jgi:hypothetical protein
MNREGSALAKYDPRVDVIHGSRPASDREQPSGVSPALNPDRPTSYTWPPNNYLELAALPTAVACARLQARNLLWEWGLDWLAPDAGLLVAELMTNAVKGYGGTRRGGRTPAVVERRHASCHRGLGRRPVAADSCGQRRGRQTRPSSGARAQAVAGGGVERALGLVSHQGTEGQGRLVRARGVTVYGAQPGRSRNRLPGRIAAGQRDEPVERRR